MSKLVAKFLNPSGSLKKPKYYYYTSPESPRYNTVLNEDGTPVPIRTSKDPEAVQYATFPDVVVTAPYTGNKRVVKVKDKDDLTTHKINEARLKFGNDYVKPVGYMMLAAPAAALTGAGVSAAGGWGAVGSTAWNHFVVPSVLNEASNTLLKKITGTTLTEQGSNFLLKNLGFDKFWGDFGGSFLEPTNYITGKGIINAVTNDGSRQAFLNTALNTVRNAALKPTWKSGDTWLPLKGSRTPTTESNTWVGNWLKKHPDIRYAVSPEFRAKIGYYSLYHQATPRYDPKERTKLKDLKEKYDLLANRENSSYNTIENLRSKYQEELENMWERVRDFANNVNSDSKVSKQQSYNSPYTYVDEFGNSTTVSIPVRLKRISTQRLDMDYNITTSPDYGKQYESILPQGVRLYKITLESAVTPFGQQPESLIAAISSRNARLANLIGDNGYLGGSSSLAGSGRIVGVPGDDDIITTASRYPNLIKSLEGLEIEPLHNVHGYRVESPHFRVNDKGNRQADIDVLEEDANGYAKGLVAHQIFSYFYPKRYWKGRESYVLPEGYRDYNRTRTIDFTEQSLPIKTEDLFQAAKKDPEWVAINDMLWSPLDKHNIRTRSALMQPLNLGILNRALDSKSISLFGEVKDLPKDFNLNNIEANKVFLRALRLDENLATNPDMMKAIARYYYYSAGSSTRVVIPNLITRYFPKQETFEGFLNQVKAARVAMEPKNGSWSGRGINTTLGPHGAGTNSFLGETTLYLTKLNDTVKDPETLYNLVSLLNKVTKEQAAQLNKLFKTSEFKEGDDYYKVLLYHHKQQTTDENIAIGNILGVDRILGNRYLGSNIYGNTDFRYAGGFDPNPENVAHIWSKSGIAHGSISNVGINPPEEKLIGHYGFEVRRRRGTDLYRSDIISRIINGIYDRHKAVRVYDKLIPRHEIYKYLRLLAGSDYYDYLSSLDRKYRDLVILTLRRLDILGRTVSRAHRDAKDNIQIATGAATIPTISGGLYLATDALNTHNQEERLKKEEKVKESFKKIYPKYKNKSHIDSRMLSEEEYKELLKLFKESNLDINSYIYENYCIL